MEQAKNLETVEYPPILCLGFTPWKGNYAKSTTQLINRLARKHKVMYVDYQFTFKDVISRLMGKSSLDIGPILGYKNSLRLEKTPQGTEVAVLSLPPVMPINWINSARLFRLGLRVNSFLIRRKIKKAIKKMGMINPVFVSAYNPFIGLYSIGQFNERMHCYYCYDEISGSPWAQKHGADIEKDYIEKIDLVMTSSRPLQKAKATINSNCELVQNGVDFAFFNDYFNENGLTKSDKKIIGYVGSLDERIDYALLRKVAEAFPEAEIRLIGRVVFPELMSDIEGVPNINLVGPMAYDKLAEQVAQFTVGLIPFLKTIFTKNIYPLKINEYLAMSLPVVKTDFSELPEFDELVYTGDGHDGFINQLEKALNEKEGHKLSERIDMARSNSWDISVEKFSTLISRKD